MRYAYSGSIATKIYSKNGDRATPVSDTEPHDLIVKSRRRKNETSNSFMIGTRTYGKFNETMKKFGYNVSANTIKEYGRTDFIKQHAAKNDMSVEEWLSIKENEMLVEQIYGKFYKTLWLKKN